MVDRNTGRRLAVGLLMATVIAGLTGCVPGVPVWAHLSEDGTVSFASCWQQLSADAIHLTLELDKGPAGSTVLSSATYSGPEVSISSGVAIDLSSLPLSWRSVGRLEGGDEWNYATIEAFDDMQQIYYDGVDRDELVEGEWVLANSGLGSMECDELRQGALLPDAHSEAAPSWSTVEELAAEVAMPEDQFWNIIGWLRNNSGSVSINNVALSLSSLTEQELLAFDARLRLQLYQLDTLEVWDQGLRALDDLPYDERYGDLFLRYRSTIVLGGADAVAAASDMQQAVEAATLRDADRILELAPLAQEKAGRTWPETAIPLPVESRSNLAGWTAMP